MRRLFSSYVVCHEGLGNRALHVAGALVCLAAVAARSLSLLTTGLLTLETGHVVQWLTTRDRRHSPLVCARGQLVFALPLIIAAVALCYRP